MQGVVEAFEIVGGRIAAACDSAGRRRDEVELLAVSKTFPASAVQAAYDAGHRAFGESRQQEAASKIDVLPQDIRWHFIGGLQRNKARKVLSSFQIIHSIDSIRLAEHVNRIAAEGGKRPQVYLEVNIGNEESKGGFSPEALLESAEALAGYESLEVHGLMVIPPQRNARQLFAATRELRNQFETVSGMRLPGLSMGMSGDFEDAILEGSTVVRVGSALFGNRDYPL